jgi:hypothetical protein
MMVLVFLLPVVKKMVLSCWLLSMRSMTTNVAEKKWRNVQRSWSAWNMIYQISLALFEFSSVYFSIFFVFLCLRVHVLDCFVGTVSISRRPLGVGCLVLQKGFYLSNHIPYVPWLSAVPCKWSNIDSHGVPGIWSGRYHWCDKGSLLRFLTSVFEDLKWSIWWGMLELHSNWILQRVGELSWDTPDARSPRVVILCRIAIQCLWSEDPELLFDLSKGLVRLLRVYW